LKNQHASDINKNKFGGSQRRRSVLENFLPTYMRLINKTIFFLSQSSLCSVNNGTRFFAIKFFQSMLAYEEDPRISAYTCLKKTQSVAYNFIEHAHY
jgi:hypothetical protein